MARTKAELESEIKHLKSQLAQLQNCVAEGPVIGQHFSVLLDSAPILVWTTNRELRVIEAAGGLRNPAMIGTPLADIVLPSAMGADALAAAGAALEGSPTAFRGRLSELEVAGWVAPLYAPNARIAGVAGIAIDESARRRAEYESAQVLERCDTLLQNSRQVLVMHDFHGAISNVQGPSEQLLEYAPEELSGRMFSDLLAPESRAAAAAWNQAVSVNFTPRCWESVALTRSGRKFPIRINARLVAPEGQPPCVEVVMTETGAADSRRTAWRGAEQIAREISDLLTMIAGQPKLDPHVSDRALRLSSELLALATGESAPVDVHKIVQQIASSLQRSSRRKIRITTDLRACDPKVLGDELHIYDLLLAATAKACASAPRGGEVLISSASASEALLIVIAWVGAPQRVEFRFPQTATLAAPLPRVSAQRSSGSILLIDDEEVVRRVLSRMIRDLGYVVISGSTAEALELYRSDCSGVDLVVVPSETCLRELREINPSARAVICGRDGESRVPGVEYLQKPYSLETLASVLRKALTRTAAP